MTIYNWNNPLTSIEIDKDYYTMRERLDDAGVWEPTYVLGVSVTDAFTDTVDTLLDVTSASTPIDTTEANLLWCRYVVPSYNHCYVEVDAETDYDTWMEHYISIYLRTYDKYKTLIDAFAAEESNLLDDIAQTQVTRFNDTPQNTGDFTADNYTSNYTESENASARDTKMARLNEIRAQWDDLYSQWAQEFKNLFYTTYVE